MRDEFHEIVSGWTLVNDFEALSDRIGRAAEWTKLNGPLEPDEDATVVAMVQHQIVYGLENGLFKDLF